MESIAQYMNGAYKRTALFVYRGTTALKKGHGMCFDLDYATTDTGQTATDAYGGRGKKVVQVPAVANANRFAGVLTNNYPARTAGYQLVELALPGGCAMVSQRVISTAGVGRVSCVVDSTAGDGNSGVFAWGGLSGKGSAIPLQTLAAATSGNLAITNVAGAAASVYAAGTGLTTITQTGAGTAMGYTATAVDASAYEMTVFDGATAAEGATRANPGVYPVVQATGANTFTVTGDTGDGALTTSLTKADLLMLAYLEDGLESGLVDFVTPNNGAARQFVLNQGGTTFICGGTTLTGDSTVNTLADPATIGGLGDEGRKAFYALGTTTTSDYIVTVTSGISSADHTTALATIVIDTAADEVVLQWQGSIGPSTVGAWHDTHHVGCTYT